jgi:hypothetical protein
MGLAVRPKTIEIVFRILDEVDIGVLLLNLVPILVLVEVHVLNLVPLSREKKY